MNEWTPAPTEPLPHWEPLRLLVAGTFAVDGLAEPLRVWASEVVGVPISVRWAGYAARDLDTLTSADGAFRAQRGGVGVLFVRLEDLLTDHPEVLLPLGGAACASALDGAAERLAAALELAASGAHACPLVVCCTPASPSLSGSATAGAALDRAHALLRARLRAAGLLASGRVSLCERGRAEALCDDACGLQSGEARGREAPAAGSGARGRGGSSSGAAAPRWHAPFLERMAHAPYTPAAMSALASLALREALRSAAARRKVLAVDCDGTLWRGAVAELGPARIGLTPDHLALQRLLISRQKSGALVCLCSRNEEADVSGAFRERGAEMALRLDEHVLSVCANWRRKSANVRELSQRLGLPLSAFLFVDDSAAECAEVRCALGADGIAVVQLPRAPEGEGAEGRERPALALVVRKAGGGGARAAEDGEQGAAWGGERGAAGEPGAAGEEGAAPFLEKRRELRLSRYLSHHWALDVPFADGEMDRDGSGGDGGDGGGVEGGAARCWPGSDGVGSDGGGGGAEGCAAQSPSGLSGLGSDGGRARAGEDGSRTQLYRAMLARSTFQSAATSADAFMASLNLRVRIRPLLPRARPLLPAPAGAAAVEAPAAAAELAEAAARELGDEDDGFGRAAQLTERTNQHNARKLTLSAAHLRAAAAAGRHTILDVHSADRFGDHGHVGLVILEAEARALPPRALRVPALPLGAAPARGEGAEREADAGPSAAGGDADADDGSAGPASPVGALGAALHVRAWLLSCRTLHVGIEHAMLGRVCEIARGLGASHLAFDWACAPRNEPAGAFLWAMAEEAPAESEGAAGAPPAAAPSEHAATPAAGCASFFVPGAAALASLQQLAPDHDLLLNGGRDSAEREAADARAREEADLRPLPSAAQVAARLVAIVRAWHAPGGPGGSAPLPPSPPARPVARLPRWPSPAELELLLTSPAAAEAVKAAEAAEAAGPAAEKAAETAAETAAVTESAARAAQAAPSTDGPGSHAASVTPDGAARSSLGGSAARAARSNGAWILARLLKAAARGASASAATARGAAAAPPLGSGSQADAQASPLAPLEDQLRARLTGALCRHALAGQPCRYEDCPYDHDGAEAARAARRATTARVPAPGATPRAGSSGPATAVGREPPLGAQPTRVASAPAAPAPALARELAGAPPAAEPRADAPFGGIQFNRPDRGVSVYQVSRAARPAAGQLFVPLGAAERCARSLRFIGQPQAQPRPQEGAQAQAERPPTGARVPFDHGARTFALHDETTDAIALGLSVCPRAVHTFVLARCRGLGCSQMPPAFVRAWEEALELDRAALGAPADREGARKATAHAEGSGELAASEELRQPPVSLSGEEDATGSGASDAQAGGAADHAQFARAHAHLRREIRHGLQVRMQESNPQSYYAQVEHHFN